MRWWARRRRKRALRALAKAEAALEAYKEAAKDEGLVLYADTTPVCFWERYRYLQEVYFEASVRAAKAEAGLDCD